MIVGLSSTYTISAYHHLSCDLIPTHGRMYRYNVMWQVDQWLAAGLYFSPGIMVSYTNKTDHHDN
jgi:hypothetical protein